MLQRERKASRQSIAGEPCDRKRRRATRFCTCEGSGESPESIEARIFSEDYLLKRPLLAAIRRKDPPVLLIDEVDRADEEFEAFLLELLSDFQITIPRIRALSGRCPSRGSC
jgi:MoxR-like ATPase